MNMTALVISKMGSKAHANTNESGFVLLGTLFALAIMTLLVFLFSNAVNNALRMAISAEDLLAQELTKMNIEQTALYVFATRYRTAGGFYLGAIDGSLTDEFGVPDMTQYRASLSLTGERYSLGNMIVNFQDESGMAIVSPRGSLAFSSVMKEVIPENSDRAIFYARLQDYIDEDESRRLNGAEAKEYSDVKSPPPANTVPASPNEMLNILGFESLVGIREYRNYAAEFSSAPPQGLNFNAIDRPLLLALGLSETMIESFFSRRQESFFYSKSEFEDLLPYDLLQILEEIQIFPTNYIRVTTQGHSGSQALSSGLRVHPISDIEPWSYSYRVANVEEATSLDAENFPQLPEIFLQR